MMKFLSRTLLMTISYQQVIYPASLFLRVFIFFSPPLCYFSFFRIYNPIMKHCFIFFFLPTGGIPPPPPFRPPRLACPTDRREPERKGRFQVFLWRQFNYFFLTIIIICPLAS